jgi:hypothetical protein
LSATSRIVLICTDIVLLLMLLGVIRPGLMPRLEVT